MDRFILRVDLERPVLRTPHRAGHPARGLRAPTDDPDRESINVSSTTTATMKNVVLDADNAEEQSGRMAELLKGDECGARCMSRTRSSSGRPRGPAGLRSLTQRRRSTGTR